jgi:hypothetical protein
MKLVSFDVSICNIKQEKSNLGIILPNLSQSNSTKANILQGMWSITLHNLRSMKKVTIKDNKSKLMGHRSGISHNPLK